MSIKDAKVPATTSTYPHFIEYFRKLDDFQNAKDILVIVMILVVLIVSSDVRLYGKRKLHPECYYIRGTDLIGNKVMYPRFEKKNNNNKK